MRILAGGLPVSSTVPEMVDWPTGTAVRGEAVLAGVADLSMDSAEWVAESVLQPARRVSVVRRSVEALHGDSFLEDLSCRTGPPVARSEPFEP